MSINPLNPSTGCPIDYEFRNFIATPDQIRLLTVGDFDGDRFVDVIYTNEANQLIRSYNNGQGSFDIESNSRSEVEDLNESPHFLKCGDFNADERDECWIGTTDSLILKDWGTSNHTSFPIHHHIYDI